MSLERLVDFIKDETEFFVREYENEIELEYFTQLGEDFFFSVDAPNEKECIQNIIDFCENFDEEEHFSFWISEKFLNKSEGIPSPFELVEDSKQIKKDLHELALKLKIISSYFI